MRKGKTMSMVLLDIDSDERLGPRYVAPFSSDLDECDDAAAEDDDDDDRGGRDMADEERGRMYGMPLSSVSNDRDDGSSFSTTDVGCDLICPRDDVVGETAGEGGDGGTSEGDDAKMGDPNTESLLAKSRPPVHPFASPPWDVADRSSGRDNVSNDGSLHSREGSTSSSSSSSSLTPPPLLCDDTLKCQGYTTTHLEALHLHRDAGRDDKRRANSLCDAPSSSSSSSTATAAMAPSKDWQWKPILDVVDGSLREPSSARSTDTFVKSFEGECERSSDIVMPNLSFTENFASATGTDTFFLRPQDPSNVKKDFKHYQTSTKYVPASSNDIVNLVEGGRTIIQSSSCASDMTIKTGNVHFPPSAGMRSASISGASSSVRGKYRPRSASCSSSVGANSSSVKDPVAFSDFSTMTATVTMKRNNMDKFKSPDKHHPLQDPIASTPAQTMKEYVMNDLLNIDSRNQDGSATEDIDENMEEFLRVPPKLEGLMLFSLAVCIDSFLYVWAMLPLKFVWGLVSLACSAYSPKKGVKGVKFHRR
jgi:hypothetical protein